jgi:hypothetical protein
MTGPDRSDQGGRVVRVERYGWYRETDDRPGLPWIGIFLVIFGGLLLLEQVAPELRAAGSLVVLAFGLAFLVSWIANRRMSALYVGAVVTALSLAAALTDLNVITGEGWGTLFLGIAFVGIAAVRAAGGGGLGWQAIFGGLLVVIGGSTVASHLAGVPDASRLVWPLVIVVLGLLLLIRGTSRRDFRA